MWCDWCLRWLRELTLLVDWSIANLVQTNHFNIGSLMERGIRLIGNGQAPVHLYWEDLMKKIQDNSINPLNMVSHRVRLEEMEELYKRYDERMEGLQKVFVATKFSAPPAPGAPQLTSWGTASA